MLFRTHVFTPPFFSVPKDPRPQATLGANASAWLIWSLQRSAIVVGSIWLAVGCGYLLVRTRGLRVPLRSVAHEDPAVGAGVRISEL